MAKALDMAEALAVKTGANEVMTAVRDCKQQMEPISYECLGCKRCWGAEAANLAYAAGADPESLCCDSARNERRRVWPVVAGDYMIGSANARVAVCTLSNAQLPAEIVDIAGGTVAIAGKCETENIGVEKIVLNIVSNPKIRWLILCGTDAEGHWPGSAILKLKEFGVDTGMKVLNTGARRPVLKNLSLVEVSRFREQIEVVSRIGSANPGEIAALTTELAGRELPRLPDWKLESRQVPHITARPPENLKLDKAGFFVVIPDRTNGVIACEHYSCDGVLMTVINGKSADMIASTVVEMGLISQLDHAAYLGRELTKAEMSLKLGIEYVQDRALGDLPEECEKKNSDEGDCSTGRGCSSCH
ncbi:MAG: DUF4346 domain-containing protein [Armatimonadetes bacterium]|nr:DUF4346 domain-containing protein [Armatimonadota bacterium]MCL5104818.1 DUF4346 domain-containing protein [Armatimonadota bacterium]